MKVQAKTGTRCPMESNPRQYITDTAADVPETTYYRRLLEEGSLVAVPETPEKKTGRRPKKRYMKKHETGITDKGAA